MTKNNFTFFAAKPVINKPKEKIMSILKTKTAGTFILPALFLGFSPTTQAVECGDPCTSTGLSPQFKLVDTNNVTWEMETVGDHFRIAPAGLSSRFEIQNGADVQQLHLNANGNVGIRTGAPQIHNELEIVSNSPTAGGQADIALSPDGPAGDSGRMSVNATSNLLSLGVRKFGTGYHSPFQVDLGAPNHSLTIHDSGLVGIGESIGNINTAAQLHVGGSGGRSGNIFLDSTGTADDWLIDPGSAGLWLRNGNATNSPAQIKFENGAPENSLVMASDGNMGIGTDMPTALLHVKKTGAQLTVEDSNVVTAVRNVVKLKNNGGVGFQLEDTSNTNKWEFRTGGSGAFLVSDVNVGGAKMLMNTTGAVYLGKNVAASSNDWNFILDADGDMHILGNMYVSGTQLTVPDYVFADDYKLMSLDELQSFVQKEKHLPNIASESEVKKAKAINVGKSQMRHLEKIEELTLYTLQQHQQIKEQKQQIEALRISVTENTKMKEQLAALEKLVTKLASASEHLGLLGERVVAAK